MHGNTEETEVGLFIHLLYVIAKHGVYYSIDCLQGFTWSCS